LYARREIADVLGGGVQDFLPHTDVVLPGKGPDIVRWANVFAGQQEFVPVFVKRATNAWQYVGDFKVVERSTNPEQIARWEAVSGRGGEISMILFLASKPQAD
jgi:hypothetical protein